jgi:hypothetical protein
VATSRSPFYAKLRVDADDQLLLNGTGQLYLGFHLDPLYDFHWNNLTQPIQVEIQPAGAAEVSPAVVEGPKVDVTADADPREFLVHVKSWEADKPLRVTVRYFACNDEKGLCVAVQQSYTLHRQFDRDSGWPEGREQPQLRDRATVGSR